MEQQEGKYCLEKENVFFFLLSERELKKALRDTLKRAAWYGLLSTMANCAKINISLFRCFFNHLSNYTKTIIRLRLVNIIHLMYGPEGNS